MLTVRRCSFFNIRYHTYFYRNDNIIIGCNSKSEKLYSGYLTFNI
jgi:hypothetical protein